MSAKEEIQKLSSEEIFKLLMAYSDYVMDFDCEQGEPVCVKEFFEWEYQDSQA